MKCNIGKADRAIRIIIGLAIIVLGIIFQSWLGLIGIVPILTGLIRCCPLYIPFKINTDKKSND